MKFINFALMMGMLAAENEKCSIDNTDCSEEGKYCMLILATFDKENDYEASLVREYRDKYSGGECMTFDECPAFSEEYMKDLDPKVGEGYPVTEVVVNCLVPPSMELAIIMVILPIMILAAVLYCKSKETCCFVDEEKLEKEAKEKDKFVASNPVQQTQDDPFKKIDVDGIEKKE